MHPDKKYLENIYQGMSPQQCRDQILSRVGIPGLVVIDLETTDFDGVPVEVACVDLHGTVLFESLVNTDQPIHPKAQGVHGISAEMIKDAPTFPEIADKLTEVIGDSFVGAYNAIFDWETLRRAWPTVDVPEWLDARRWECIMRAQSVVIDGGGQWRKLQGSHRAAGDAIAAAEVARNVCTHLFEP